MTKQKLKFSLREKRWEREDGGVYLQPLLVSECVLSSWQLYPRTKCKGRPCFGLVEGYVHDGPNLDYTPSEERIWFNGVEWQGKNRQVYTEAKMILLMPNGRVYFVK